MRAAMIAAAAVFALGACGANEGNEAANTDNVDFSIDETNAAGTDPATTNLTTDAAPSEVDQAINRTDEQSALDNTVANATNSAQ